MKYTNKFTRREFVKRTAVAGAGVALLTKFAVPSARALNNSPALQKWIQPLRGLGPTGIPVLSSINDPVYNTLTNPCQLFRVTVGEFLDQLHPSLPPTRLWGYWDTTNAVPRHLGGVIAITRGTAARIRFTNVLPARHILPVDITLPGANLAQNRIATHIHGGLVPWISDGGPYDWWTPGCPDYSQGLSFLNGPGGLFDNLGPFGMPMVNGQADYYYPNNQSTRLMWYHDHAHGITRLNAYAGIASGYLIIDPANDAARLTANTPATAGPNWFPLVWQEKKFVSATTPVTDPTWADVTRDDVHGIGSLWYEHTYNPKLWTLKAGLPLPDPSVIAEFFGDTMLCNGTVYPKLTLPAGTYRFMLLNATNARFLNINVFKADATADGITLGKGKGAGFPANPAGPPIHQIGTEGGYLAKEVIYTTSAATAFNPATLQGNLILGPAERADVVIDFTTPGDYILYNDAPAPFPGGAPINDYYPGNGANPIVTTPGFGPDTRQLLRISITGTSAPKTGLFLTDVTTAIDPPSPALATAVLPAAPLTPAPLPVLAAPLGTTVRPLTLNEAFDKYGRLIQMLGTTAPQVGGGFGQPYTNPPTEVIAKGMTEVWQIYNTTADTHPMHFHLVNAQVLSRQPFKMTGGVPAPTGAARGPEVNELGWKETIKMHPGEVTNILMTFDLPTGLPFTIPSSPRMDTIAASATPGLLIPGKKHHEYVWHCHILEHEEHDMMRPLVVEE
jgi:spore coat protein A, manganese oxidase